MSYCTGKHIEKSRGDAMRELVIDKRRICDIAHDYKVNRTTIWRWHQKWLAQNKDVQLQNTNRCKDDPTSMFRYGNIKWNIPTESSVPLHSHCLSPELVQLVLDVKDQLKRCAEVVWYYINEVYCIKISLSSVRRILKKHHRTAKRKKKHNSESKGLPRPNVLLPGDLVEIDTIHLYNPISKSKVYIYTVIDLYTRMSYARVYKKLAPGIAARTILEAEQYFGFKFKLVQSDNGPEFSSYFEKQLKNMSHLEDPDIPEGEKRTIQIRHTRLGRPNDNAHIERFNRTIQEECTGRYYIESIPIRQLDNRILSYIDFYNYHRVHLGLKYMTPAQMLRRC